MEPWLSGPLAEIDPLIANVFYTFQQAREELAAHTAGLSTEQVWSHPHGLTPLGFHIRHMGGSVDRLSTYLRGEPLSGAQMISMASEPEPGESLDQLLTALADHFRRCEAVVRAVDLDRLHEPRQVGRKRLPTTVIGLIVHMAEHTQRHLGQAITTAKLLAREAGR